MAYDRYEDLLRPARTRPELWRLVAGVLISIALTAFLFSFFGQTILSTFGETAGRDLLDEITLAETPRGALILLCSLGFLAAGPVLLARPIHWRSPLTLIGPPGRALLDFLVAMRALIILGVIIYLLPGGPEPEKAMSFGKWFALLPLTLAAILVQSGAEELVFRGYLQSEIAARFRSPLIWMVLPSALFAWAHYAPDETGANAIWIAALAFTFGVIAADLTARTGTLGAALAFHFANNVFALAFTALSGPVSGLALYIYPFGVTDTAAMTPLLWVDLAVMGVSWLAIRLALRV